jgi:O-antigen/teichoic acid export membrane protein
MPKEQIKEMKNDFLDVLRRFRKKDFSGNTGLAIKNSAYQFSTNLVLKIGSLIFIVVLARMLLPELFGLYNLALSTILLFFVISNFGIGPTLVKFVSRELGKGKEGKARAYVSYLWKVKLFAALASVLVLLAAAKFISDVYYQKPLFLALVAGSLYILFYGISTFLEYVLQASNNFGKILGKETLFQVLRIVFVPLAVLLAINYSLSDESLLFYLFLALAGSYLLIALFVFFFQVRKIQFMNANKEKLSGSQKKKVNKFMIAVSAMVFSGLFFDYVDKIMLGHFVHAEFIGYYSAALGLVGSLIALEGFGTALLPVFSRARGNSLETGLRKSSKMMVLLSVLIIALFVIIAPFMINLFYGQAYSPSSDLLRLMSLLLIPMPLVSIYGAYFISKGKPLIIARLLLLSTLLNIILNYVLITSLIGYGDMAAVFGAGIATLISQFFYLGGLMIKKGK